MTNGTPPPSCRSPSWTTTPGTTCSASSRSAGSSRSSGRSCCWSRPIRGRACFTTGWPRNSRAVSTSMSSQLPQPYTLNDVVCWFLGARGRREEAYVRLRGILQGCDLRAAPGAAPPGGDLRIRPVRHHHLRPAARDGHQPGTLRRAPVDRSDLLLAQSRRRPADRARPAAAARGLSPVRPPVRLARPT